MWYVEGEGDGVYNGKRYFKCLEGHAIMLSASNIISILQSNVSLLPACLKVPLPLCVLGTVRIMMRVLVMV